jgi:DNA-binding transcriptional LysR family regulator
VRGRQRAPSAGQQEAIELTDIADEPMLTLRWTSRPFPRYLIQCCVKAGFQPTIFQEASEPQTLLAMVGAGLGVALMPETTSRIGWPGVVFLPIGPIRRRRICISPTPGARTMRRWCGRSSIS